MAFRGSPVRSRSAPPTSLRPLRLDFALRAHQLRGFAPAAKGSSSPSLGDSFRRDKAGASRRPGSPDYCPGSPFTPGRVSSPEPALRAKRGGAGSIPFSSTKQELPLDFKTTLRVAARLIDRTGDLRGFGGPSPPPGSAPRRTTTPKATAAVRCRSAPRIP